MNNRWDKVRGIWGIIERLRGESGCPWDRKQTPETVQTYLVEEAHEGAAAVRGGRIEEVADELGDVLFMVLFLVYLYEERGDFSLEEVCARISEKMVRRHPHVFGEISVETAEEVKDNWEKIKADEKRESGKVPEPVPESLPALMRAYRIVSRLAHKDNGRWNDLDLQVRDFSRKTREMVDALSSGGTVSAESIGEILFELVNIARLKGYRAEDCLHQRLRETP
ncbi:MAG: MazG family protein [Syntrophobacteraceae bacterium]